METPFRFRTLPILTAPYTDTLGQPVLTVNNNTYSYTDALGAARTVTVNYSSYTEQSHFGWCGGGDYGPWQASLPSSIGMPDGSSYGITYEVTPGFPNSVTGRITKVTLPTGGSISYSYTGGSSGLDCSSRYVPILTRTLTNSDGSTAVWKYDGQTLPAPQVIVTDPYNNETVYTFGAATPGYGELNYGLESQKLIYSGSHSGGTLLKTVVTCYNGNSTNCATTSPQAGVPITEKDTTTTIAGMSTSSQSKLTFNSNGLLTRDREYDFGASTPTIDRSVSYGSYSGGSCQSLGAYINNRVCSDVTKNGTGTVFAQTNNSYDANGNLTSTSSLVSGSTYLTKSFTYNANGTIATATDVNGAQSTPTYGACNGLMPTSIAEPLSLSVSMTWDCNGGVMTSRTDENGQTSYTNYFVNSSADPSWRALQTKDALGNITNFTYGVNSTESAMVFNSGASTVDVLTTIDGLGQAIITQKRQAPGSANWDTVSKGYDKVGRVASVSQPCTTTAGAKCPATPATTFQYDAVSRPTLTTDAGNGTVSYSYSKNDALVTVGPAPTGEHAKSRQLESDGLGRLTSVCEVTSATGSGTCTQANSQTGYWTKYTYDALGNLTGVTQNAQGSPQETRSYGPYDGLGRLTSESNPETGTTRYVYDVSSGTTCASWGYTAPYPGDLVEKDDANGNATCSQFDGLHRLLATYNFGPNTTPSKHFVYDNDSINGVTMNNAKGRMAGAFTCTAGASTCTGNVITDEYFNYSAYHPTAAYWANGALNNLWMSGLPSVSYGVDGEGRTSAVGATSGQNPVTGTSYNAASQVTAATFGSGDSDTLTFDPNTGRMTQYKFNVNGQSQIGNLGWNANSTLKTLGITDPFNTINTQSCSYAYDDLTRLQSASCGTKWAQTFVYDAFGNTTKSGSSSWQPTYNTKNQYQSIPGFPNPGPTYDANGDILTDSFNTYTWDAEGHVTAINSIGLTYDALGRQVEQNQNGTYFQIVYAPMGSKLAVMKGQTIQQAFVPLPGGTTAEYLSWGLSHYRHPDWLGSERLESSPTRAIIQDTSYGPFGEPYGELSGGNGEISFTGQNKDTDWLNYDFMYREYDPRQSRWISPDPSGIGAVNPSNPQSWNRYVYALNNPLKYTDPRGLYCQWADGTRDDDPSEGGATYEDCVGDPNNEGKWIDTTTVTVNGDSPDAIEPQFENGEQIFPQIWQSYGNCVKETGNYFSLQNGLRSISGGKWGNGWLSGALLGNPVSDVIAFGQGLADHNSSEAGKSGPSAAVGIVDPAGRTLEAASTLQDVTVVTASAAVTTIQIPGASVTSISVNATSSTIPLGTLGKIAKPLASAAKGLNVWNYGVSAVSAGVLCAIGR